jgi:HD-GYP domain-containing protein (c-di-GMP phosphodiesterase class II)
VDAVNRGSEDPESQALKTREEMFSQELRVVKGAFSKDEEDSYYPLQLRVIFPKKYPFTLYLKTLEGKLKKIKYLPYCHKGEVFQESWLAKLRDIGINQLYFHVEDLDAAIAFLNSNLLIFMDDLPVINQGTMVVFFEHLHLTVRRLATTPLLGENIQQANWQVDWVIKQLDEGILPHNLLWESLLQDYNMYHHAVNVFLVSVAFMHFLQKGHTACRIVGIAALFHDIGLTKISPDILYKPGPLTAAERQEIQSHPELAVNMLRESPEILPESLRLVHEHHENADGSGYPQGLSQGEQHKYTAVLRMVDAYDALTSPRPHRPAHTPFKALGAIQQQWGTVGPVFDRSILGKFIEFLAL